MADVQRRLLRPPLQHADQDQRRERRARSASPGSTASTSRTRRPSAIKGTPLVSQRRDVSHRAGSRLGGRRAHRARDLAPRLDSRRAASTSATAASAVLGDSLYYETPDCNLVSLNIKDGTERWHKQICDLEQFYYGSVAPIIVEEPRHRRRERRRSRRPRLRRRRTIPETGEMQWRWYVVPQKKGDPGIGDLAERGGGAARRRHDVAAGHLRSRAEPDLRRRPAIRSRSSRHANRAGDNLFTASIVALNPDTGKMVWYFQSSPHDTHDWDATQTPVLIDGEIDGQPRKLLAQASRNGKFFVLDRTNGKAIVSSEFVKTNWSNGYDAKGQPIPEPGEEAADRRRARLAESGRRDELAAAELQPADRTLLRRRRRAPSASTTSTIRATTRRAGAAPIAAAGRSRCCRRSTTRPARSAGATRGTGDARSGLLSTAGNLLFAGGNSRATSSR